MIYINIYLINLYIIYNTYLKYLITKFIQKYIHKIVIIFKKILKIQIIYRSGRKRDCPAVLPHFRVYRLATRSYPYWSFFRD
jgi:hypothetical protein